MKRALLWVCCLFSMAPVLIGQMAFTDSVLTVTENFDTFDSDGFVPTSSSPTAGQLNSDNWRVAGLSTDETMAFGDIQTGTDFTGGSSIEDWGGTTTGGVQHIDDGTGNVVFGIQPSSVDFTAGAIEFRVQNNASSAITLTSIAYDVYSYNDKTRSSYFNGYYSTVGGYVYNDASTLNNYTLVSSYTSPGADDDTLTTINVSESVSIQVDPGDFVYILWEGDNAGSGSGYDEFAIDNVSLGAQVIPEPSTYALIFGGLALAVVFWKRKRSGVSKIA